MTSKKIIAVTGATGAQGGSVAKFLLQDGTFSVRAVTRNPDTAAAKELASRGAEVVKGDFRDSASLAKAFEGVYGVFGLTNYWEPGVGGEGELAQGKALVDASKAAGVKHFIWSTLDHCESKAGHWESKAEVDDYLKASGVPRTSLYTVFYFENFTGILGLNKKPDGSYDFPLPLSTDEKFGIYSVDETGAWALAAFKEPGTWLDRDLRVASEFLSPREIAKTIGDVSGKNINVQEVSPEVYESFKGNALPDELHANFKALYEYNKPPLRDPQLSRSLYPEMKTFRAWVELNIDKIVT